MSSRWLREKHRQSLAERHQLSANAARVRRHQHHIRTRYQCQDHELKRSWESS